MERTADTPMPKVLCVYGNPKSGGFVHECLDHLCLTLRRKGAHVEKLHLSECYIRDCIGCFQCLRSGRCSVEDDMDKILDLLRSADGIVAGASVRNGFFPAVLKLFYERITYLAGFSRDLKGKYVLAVGSVGIAGGRRNLGKLLTFREFQTYVSDYLFFRVGIPSKLRADAAAPRLDAAADRFYEAIQKKKKVGLLRKLAWRMDDFVVRRFMLEPNPINVYDWIISQWKSKGLMEEVKPNDG